jgi:hypothetical protein
MELNFLSEISLDLIRKGYISSGISDCSEFVDKFSNEFKRNLWYLIEYVENSEEWKDVF